MGSLITLAVYAAMAAAVVAGAFAFLSHEQGIGAAKQLAKDQPVLQACVADKKTAVDANNTLKDDVVTLTDRVKLANDAIDAWQRTAVAAVAAADKARATNASKIAFLESDQAQAIRAAAVAVSGLTCPQFVTNQGNALHDLAVREARDRGGKPAVAPVDTLRVR